ncbi:MAG: hypothetical protein AB1646_21095 [Thermodesulfobacteriota bacterium]
MKRVALCGIVTIVLAGIVVSAEAQWPLGKDISQLAPKKEDPTHVTATGRFQIFVSPNHKGHTFMLDTDTGKIWLMKKDSLSGNFSMERIPIQEVDKDAKPSTQKTQEAPAAK